MTELLSREKEFRSINQKLDKFTANILEQNLTRTTEPEVAAHRSTSPSGAASARTKSDSRYATYTKAKGPSTLLKKRGAGDGGSEEMPDAASKNRTMVNRQAQSASNRKNSVQSPIHSGREDNSNKASTYAAAVAAIQIATVTNSNRKALKSDSLSRTNNRNNGNRTCTRSPTFNVKYRNPHFVQSPSLEVLVKDEIRSLQQQNLPQSPNKCAKTPDLESVGSTQSKRSQGKPSVNNNSLIKFLKSKIAILEETNERITKEMADQKELLEKTLERHKKVEHQRDAAFSKHNALTEQLGKVELQLDDANRRLKERSVDSNSQQKELENVKRELKVVTQTNANLEKRLYKANEELQNAKNALALMKDTEREIRETVRQDKDSKDKQIKSLKKQRADLLNAYKKQLYLIDNLKLQNIYLEQSKMIGIGEKEFTKILDWNKKI